VKEIDLEKCDRKNLQKERNILHSSIGKALLPPNAEFLEAVTRSLDIVHAYGNMSKSTARFRVARSVSFEVGVFLCTVVIRDFQNTWFIDKDKNKNDFGWLFRRKERIGGGAEMGNKHGTFPVERRLGFFLRRETFAIIEGEEIQSEVATLYLVEDFRSGNLFFFFFRKFRAIVKVKFQGEIALVNRVGLPRRTT
jgi:hypothetical protein